MSPTGVDICLAQDSPSPRNPFLQSPFATNTISQRTATFRIAEDESALSASGDSRAITLPFSLSEIESDSSTASQSPFSEQVSKPPSSSEPDAPCAGGKDNSAVPVTSLAVSTENTSMLPGVSGESSAGKALSSLDGIGSDSSSVVESQSPSLSFSQSTKPSEQVKDVSKQSLREPDAASKASGREKSSIPVNSLAVSSKKNSILYAASGDSSSAGKTLPFSEIGSGTSSAASESSPSSSVSQTTKSLKQTEQDSTPSSEATVPKASDRETSTTLLFTSSLAVSSVSTTPIGSGASGSSTSGEAPISVGELGSGSSVAINSPFSSLSPELNPLKEAEDSMASSDAARASSHESSTIAMSSLVVSKSLRVFPYSFDLLTLPLYAYMSELSQEFPAAVDTSHELSEVNSDDSNESEDNIEVDLDGGSSFLPKRFVVDPLSFLLFLETNHSAESDGSVIIEQPSTHICLKSTTGTASRSPKGSELALARDFQSIRAAHYSFDPLTLALHAYGSEQSQIPVTVSSKADASDGHTEVNSDDSNGSEDIRPWTPYNRRSSPPGDSLTGSKGIRQVNPEDGGTSFPFSSESVVNIETRGMKPDQESSSLSKGLLVDSMAMALLLEVNEILEQDRCASSENSRREISFESTAGSAYRVSEIRKRTLAKENKSNGSIQSSSDALTVPVQNDATGSEAIGQVNYFCCDWW
jgi:hypothetical protein